MCEKKNGEKSCRLLLGYCPFLACTGSRYSSCIVTQRLGRLAWAQPGGPRHGQPRPRYDHGKATIWPRHGPRQGWPRAKACCSAHARVAWLVEGRDTKTVSWHRGGRP